jgi:hypothetical protein
VLAMGRTAIAPARAPELRELDEDCAADRFAATNYSTTTVPTMPADACGTQT